MKSQSDFSAMDFGTAFDAMNPAKFMDSMQSLQKSWAGFATPAGLTPTLNLEELDKRIADLKAVEQWLSMNLTMLQSTVQALQVQRATIATLRNLQDTMASAAETANQPTEPVGGAGFAEAMGRALSGTLHDQPSSLATAIDPAAWWNMLHGQFASIANAAMATTPAPSPTADPAKPQAPSRAKAATRKKPSAAKSARTRTKKGKAEP